MKKHSGHDELLKDLLDETAPEGFRSATLERGLSSVRRTRRRRAVWRAAPVIITLILAATFVGRYRHQPVSTPIAPEHIVKVIPGTTIRVLSDEELLSFFKGRPVALVGQPGNQRLVLFDELPN